MHARALMDVGGIGRFIISVNVKEILLQFLTRVQRCIKRVTWSSRNFWLKLFHLRICGFSILFHCGLYIQRTV